MKKSLIILTVLMLCQVSWAQDSLNVSRFGELRNWQWPQDFAVQGHFAYVLLGFGELAILDLSDPALPVLVSRCHLPHGAFDIAVSGNYAYASTYGDEPDADCLQVIDISNPADPVWIAFYGLQCGFVSVEVVGNFAYVGDYYGYLRILDVSNPAAPVQIGAYSYDTTTFIPSAVEVVGNRAFVADWSRGLRILDVSSLTNPTEIGFCGAPAWVSDVAVSGNYAYLVSTDAGLRVINISNPAAPVEVGSCLVPGYAGSVAVSGNYAYVADGSLRIVDVSNPNAPHEVSNFDTYYVTSVIVRNNLAYVLNAHRGLQIVNVNNPAAPVLVGNYMTFESAKQVAVSGDYAYIADTEGYALQVISVSNPSAPVSVGSCPLPSAAWDVAVRDTLAFVASAYGAAAGLRIIDVRVPSYPQEVGSTYDFLAFGVALNGNYAYVAGFDSGGWVGRMLVFDVSNAATPVRVGLWDSPSGGCGVAVNGDFAYVATGASGLFIVDVSNPASPVTAGTFDTPGSCLRVSVSGEFAYVADYDGGIRIVNVADPTHPVEVGSYSTPYASDVKIGGNYAYVADETAGLRVLDISTPSSPVEMGYYDGPGSPQGVAVRNGLAYVAAASRFCIYDCSAATGISESPVLHPSSFILSCYPNPFNSATQIEFTLPSTQHVSLRLYDVLGREVMVLMNEIRTAGQHEMMFDASGLPSGVYLCRLEAGEMAQTRKMVLIK